MTILIKCLLPALFAAQSVPIPDSMRKCAKDSECTEVEPQCNQCCGREAIRRSAISEFNRLYQETCRDYKGPVCDCYLEPARAQCLKGKCQIVHTGGKQ